VFKALADPTRRKILDELAERNGQTLFEICSRLATKHQLAVRRELERLTGLGVRFTQEPTAMALSRPPCSTTPAAT
jgi:DNA-binding transcriptional ArsR family regulator